MNIYKKKPDYNKEKTQFRSIKFFQAKK